MLQSPAGQKSPINLQIHPFSARNNLRQSCQKPYFEASKKSAASHQVSPPDSRRHQYMKQFIGSIFDEECLSGRASMAQGQCADKEHSTQASRIRR